MNEEQATNVAEAVGGTTWQSGGDIWLVLIERSDAKLVVISGDVVCEYDNQVAFEKNNPTSSILLN